MTVSYGEPADVVGMGRVTSEVITVSSTPAIAESGVALAVNTLVRPSFLADRLA